MFFSMPDNSVVGQIFLMSVDCYHILCIEVDRLEYLVADSDIGETLGMGLLFDDCQTSCFSLSDIEKEWLVSQDRLKFCSDP